MRLKNLFVHVCTPDELDMIEHYQSRAERLADVLCAMRSHGIEPKRLRFLAKSPDAAPSLLFVEGKRGGKSGLVIEPPLVPNGEEWDAVYFRK